MNEIGPAAMAAVMMLQELDARGVAVMLECRTTEDGRSDHTEWKLSARLRKGVKFAEVRFTDAEILQRGDWIEFAARTTQWILDMLRESHPVPR